MHNTINHCTTLHCTSLPNDHTIKLNTALHNTTLHYSTLPYTTLPYTTQHYPTQHSLPYTTQHYPTQLYTTLPNSTLQHHHTLLYTSPLHFAPQPPRQLGERKTEKSEQIYCFTVIKTEENKKKYINPTLLPCNVLHQHCGFYNVSLTIYNVNNM